MPVFIKTRQWHWANYVYTKSWGNSVIISSSNCPSTSSQIPSSSPLSDQTCTHTQVPTTRYDHYTPHSSLLHNWAPCSDTKSSSRTARLNYSKSQCRITLKTGVENRTVNDIAFHGFREFNGHLFLTQTYYCTSNLSYNTGSRFSDAVNPKNCEFLTEQWQSRPLSKSCSKLVTFHITGYSVGGGLPPLIATAHQTPFKIP
jgi:hypothetical protein